MCSFTRTFVLVVITNFFPFFYRDRDTFTNFDMDWIKLDPILDLDLSFLSLGAEA